jgi:hypothetical protein
MAKWLTSLVLITVIAGSALAGMPLHSSEQECSMTGMSGDMDCCRAAHSQGETPEAAAARLCCAVNCPQTGTNAPPGTQLPRISPPASIALHPAAIQPPTVIPIPRLRSDLSQDYLQNSQPTYIRHLALLI